MESFILYILFLVFTNSQMQAMKKFGYKYLLCLSSAPYHLLCHYFCTLIGTITLKSKKWRRFSSKFQLCMYCLLHETECNNVSYSQTFKLALFTSINYDSQHAAIGSIYMLLCRYRPVWIRLYYSSRRDPLSNNPSISGLPARYHQFTV